MRGWSLIVMAAALLTVACGEKNQVPPSRQAQEKAMAVTDPVLRIAALETWLADFPKAAGEDRAAALQEIWNIHLKRHEDTAGLAWASAELRDEPSDRGKGILYTLLFQNAKEKESKDAALRIAQEIWDSGLTDPGTLNQVGWALVADPGWNPDLGARLAERGVEHADPGPDRASIMDTAGWGYYLMGKKDPALRLLEGAMAELPGPDREIGLHLAALYERIGEESKLLQLWTSMLQRSMDSEMQAKAEALEAKRGGDVAAYREKLWDVRIANAKSAPDFELKDLDGDLYQLSDYRGKVVMLNFWHPS